MARNCIICEKAANSREHIFPAALGGRRTNKGIYCALHNQEYSGLAGVITEQLRLFNAQIGVVGDHASETKPATLIDVASGREVELTNSKVHFKYPQDIPKEVIDSGTFQQVTFSSDKEMKDWVLEQKAKGLSIQSVGKPQKNQYYVGSIHAQLMLGGNEEGLRAIAYIAQTFFAHYFPYEARLPELQEIKEYTLKNIGSGFVWWDFDPPKDFNANKFAFGHRVVVGLNKEDGTAYARLSLFSALHFAILLGKLPVGESQVFITDIDPLAKSPPNDIHTWSESTAKGAVFKPENLNASLAEAISSGQARSSMNAFLQRIEDHERQNAAMKILNKIPNTSTLTEVECDKLFNDIINSESQRVFRLMRYVVDEFKSKMSSPNAQHIFELLDRAVALDARTLSGLSVEAESSLVIACEALKRQMIANYKAGILDQDRMEMLIGGGRGASIIGKAIFEPIMMNLPKK